MQRQDASTVNLNCISYSTEIAALERLNQITLNDFIELHVGNYACLLSDSEFVSESTLKR